MKDRVERIAAGLFNPTAAPIRYAPAALPTQANLHGAMQEVLTKIALQNPIYLSPRRLAKVSGIGEKQIRMLMRQGRLKYVRAPGSTHVKITLPALIEALEST